MIRSFSFASLFYWHWLLLSPSFLRFWRRLCWQSILRSSWHPERVTRLGQMIAGPRLNQAALIKQAPFLLLVQPKNSLQICLIRRNAASSRLPRNPLECLAIGSQIFVRWLSGLPAELVDLHFRSIDFGKLHPSWVGILCLLRARMSVGRYFELRLLGLKG